MKPDCLAIICTKMHRTRQTTVDKTIALRVIFCNSMLLLGLGIGEAITLTDGIEAGEVKYRT